MTNKPVKRNHYMLLLFPLCFDVKFLKLSAHVPHMCKTYLHRWLRVCLDIPQSHPLRKILMLNNPFTPWNNEGEITSYSSRLVMRINNVIELSGVKFSLKSYAWSQNQTCTQCKIDLPNTKFNYHNRLSYLYFEIKKFSCKNKVFFLKYTNILFIQYQARLRKCKKLSFIFL